MTTKQNYFKMYQNGMQALSDLIDEYQYNFCSTQQCHETIDYMDSLNIPYTISDSNTFLSESGCQLEAWKKPHCLTHRYNTYFNPRFRVRYNTIILSLSILVRLINE